MEYSARTYDCNRCHDEVIICSNCDYGNIYCKACSPIAREESQRKANRKYQNTTQGKFNHAARQKKYRQRQKNKKTSLKKVTYTTSKNYLAMALSCQIKEYEIKKLKIVTAVNVYCCHFCEKPVVVVQVNASITNKSANGPRDVWMLR